MKTLLPSFACSLLALSACADSDFATEADRIEGIYRVDAHTLNQTSCAPGGAALPDQHAYAFATRGEVFGIELLSVYSCESLADCRAKAAQPQFTGAIDFDFTLTEADGGLLLGLGSSTGWAEGPVCTAPEAWSTTLELAGDTLRIEKEIRVGHDYPSDDGLCTTDRGREATEDADCSQMEVLTATLVERL